MSEQRTSKPSNDLVQRLREYASHSRYPETREFLFEAADEIERLRLHEGEMIARYIRENDRITRERDQYCLWWEEHGQKIDRLRSQIENDRSQIESLRAALEQIRDGRKGHYAPDAQYIARSALAATSYSQSPSGELNSYSQSAGSTPGTDVYPEGTKRALSELVEASENIGGYDLPAVDSSADVDKCRRSDETSDRCKHGVWVADHCYQCAAENGTAEHS